MAASGSYGIKCDPDMSYRPDYYAPGYQCEQPLVQEPTDDMDLAGFLEMDDKMLSGRYTVVRLGHRYYTSRKLCMVHG